MHIPTSQLGGTQYPGRGMTLFVSNPLCSPRFRISASVKPQKIAYALGVPSDICEFYLYFRNSTLLWLTLAYPTPPTPPGQALGIFMERGNRPPTCPLRPVMTNNACPPRITAAAGTEFM